MGVIYGITWYTMSLAMPCIFSLNSVIKNTLERKPSDRQRADTLFWLKYWVVFAYYYVLESVFDTIIAWLPLYNEVRLGLQLKLRLGCENSPLKICRIEFNCRLLLYLS